MNRIFDDHLDPDISGIDSETQDEQLKFPGVAPRQDHLALEVQRQLLGQASEALGHNLGHKILTFLMMGPKKFRFLS